MMNNNYRNPTNLINYLQQQQNKMGIMKPKSINQSITRHLMEK